MSERYTRIVVLCEDLQQRTFLYRFLVKKKVSPRAIDFKQAPAGKGAGEQYVREQFPREVRAMRAKPHLSLGLIAVVDADTGSSEERLTELAQSLSLHGQKPVSPEEAIAVLTPKRNIETWIHYLLGSPVNEEDRYPKFRDEERKCDPAVQEFARFCPGDTEPDMPPSLAAACKNLSRFLRRFS